MGRRKLRFGDEEKPGGGNAPDDSRQPDGTPHGDTHRTSGQNVPKPGGKFKQDKDKAKHSDRLRHEDAPGSGGSADPKAGKKAARESDRLDKSKLRMEKSGDKLDKAKEKLAAQKPLKKPGMLKKAGSAAKAKAWLYTHGKIYQVEDENVGIKAAHRTELAGEAAARSSARFVKKRIRTRPARRVLKWEKRDIKARADHHYRAMVHENPELEKKAVSRHFQKRRIKKRYQKQAREAAKKGAVKAGKAAKETTVKTVSITRRVGKAIVLFIKTNPKLVLIILLAFLLIVAINSCLGLVTTVGSGMGGSAIATTFPSEDADMLAAEAAYSALEAALKHRLDNFVALYPGYDEYNFDLDEIGHDPYALISILSALHEGAWAIGEVQGTLAMLFDLQYTLTVTVTVEVRYYTEYWSYTDPETGETDSGSYEVAYNYYICDVTLDNFNLSHLPVYIMGEEGLARYALYMSTLGNRPDLFPSHIYPGASTILDYERYAIPPEYFGDEVFARIIAEAEKYLGFPYVWGGSNPRTSFDCSGFVSWVINQTGWDVGRLGARALYSICTPVSPANAKPGDLVFFHSTYQTQTPGISHVGIYVGDGMMIHCGSPISYTSITTSYWVSKFYGYARLP